MKTCAALLVVSLSGCQTTGYIAYAKAMADIAEAQASVQREQTQMMMRLAEFGGDTTVRALAVVMLGAGGFNGKQGFQMPQPPVNEPLEWVRVLAGPLTTIGLGWWAYKGQKHAIDANSNTTIQGYKSLSEVAGAGFEAVKNGGNITTNVTETTTTNTTTSLTASGNSVIGSGTAITAPLTPAQLLGFGP